MAVATVVTRRSSRRGSTEATTRPGKCLCVLGDGHGVLLVAPMVTVTVLVVVVVVRILCCWWWWWW